MSSKILACVAALAVTIVSGNAGPASAKNWGHRTGVYPDYAYAPEQNYAPPYGYRGAYGGGSPYYWGPWGFRGGAHPPFPRLPPLPPPPPHPGPRRERGGGAGAAPPATTPCS